MLQRGEPDGISRVSGALSPARPVGIGQATALCLRRKVPSRAGCINSDRPRADRDGSGANRDACALGSCARASSSGRLDYQDVVAAFAVDIHPSSQHMDVVLNSAPAAWGTVDQLTHDRGGSRMVAISISWAQSTSSRPWSHHMVAAGWGGHLVNVSPRHTALLWHCRPIAR